MRAASLALLLSTSCASTGDGGDRAARLNAAKRQGASLLEAGDFAGAVRVLEGLAETASGDSQVFVLLGDALVGAGRPDDAVRSYEQALRLAYANHDAHLKLATVLMALGKTGRAQTEFEIALEYGTDQPLTHYNYGLALYELGRSRKALEHWRVARHLDPSDPRFAEAVGIGLTDNEPIAAARAFAEAESLGATGHAFDHNFGLALQESGRLVEAQARFRAAALGMPENEAYRFGLAAVEMRRGRWELAIAEWNGLLESFGERWSYRVYLARALVEAGRHDEAIAALETMVADVESGRIGRTDEVMDRVPPGLDEALSVLALAHRGRGELDEALSYIRRAVGLSPDDPSHLNNYGVILAESGMLDDARAQWRRVLELDAENATARENLSAFGP